MVFPLNRWILLVYLTGLGCGAVQVKVKEEKMLAMLFSPVVLHCQYSSRSTQTPVVQWWYKSFCTDRMQDAFTLSVQEDLEGAVPGAAPEPAPGHDCTDSGRTVRIVASGQGPSMTLAEHYKGRDIAIINKSDLRIGQLQWGDSGVYYCKVVIADDLEGKNEGQVELLVLAKTGDLEDILSEFEQEVMPEWVFVGVVGLGSVLFLLLVGVCWCQCCPHFCCCYLRCCCCPDACCCPRHLYEAGKMAKGGQPPPVVLYPPSFIPVVPLQPKAPPIHTEPKMTSMPSTLTTNITGVRSGYRLKPYQGLDSMKVVYYIERDLAQFHTDKMASHPSAGSLSELSSLHEGDTDFRQTYRQVQRKALPPISDHDDEPRLRSASVGHGLRPAHYHSDHIEELHDSRWNPRSEHLQRKPLSTRGRTGSLDELEEFAMSYGPRGGRRGSSRDPEPDYDMELRTREDHRDDLRRFHGDSGDGWRRQSSPPSPRRRRDNGDSDRYGTRGQSYDDGFLDTLLERKARGRGDRGGRADEDSDTPSKGSSRKSSDCYYSRSPSNRPEEEDPLPPYSEVQRFSGEEPVEPTGRYRTVDPSMRPFSYTRPPQNTSHTLQQRREGWEQPRKLTNHLSRDSLIV